MLTCLNGHTSETITAWDINAGDQWFECLRCGKRVLLGSESSSDILCGDCLCGLPADEHSSQIDMLLGKTHPVRHPAHGDPCVHPVAMRKRVGFLCLECGEPIEGLPVRSYD